MALKYRNCCSLRNLVWCQKAPHIWRLHHVDAFLHCSVFREHVFIYRYRLTAELQFNMFVLLCQPVCFIQFLPPLEATYIVYHPYQFMSTVISWAIKSWSERQDSNLRPPGPKPGALPNCATPRSRAEKHFLLSFPLLRYLIYQNI